MKKGMPIGCWLLLAVWSRGVCREERRVDCLWWGKIEEEERKNPKRNGNEEKTDKKLRNGAVSEKRRGGVGRKEEKQEERKKGGLRRKADCVERRTVLVALQCVLMKKGMPVVAVWDREVCALKRVDWLLLVVWSRGRRKIGEEEKKNRRRRKERTQKGTETKKRQTKNYGTEQYQQSVAVEPSGRERKEERRKRRKEDRKADCVERWIMLERCADEERRVDYLLLVVWSRGRKNRRRKKEPVSVYQKSVAVEQSRVGGKGRKKRRKEERKADCGAVSI
jgi:hypothetical protein